MGAVGRESLHVSLTSYTKNKKRAASPDAALLSVDGPPPETGIGIKQICR
ncbi:hypothetical protein DES53_1093 [Roseimicrobium gellanilyticum]|uniref:Uncharacterized protein n=1 Tax=Roseimicrobium gellanilyticum TaxID=748857 RepID=A0A366HB95_9BACT|nr:hypothetical protein DES53_1093 [Roseimicrobium gellanilyticum]